MQLARVIVPGLLLFASACGETTPGDPAGESKSSPPSVSSGDTSNDATADAAVGATSEKPSSNGNNGSKDAKPHTTETEQAQLPDPPQLLSSDEIADGWISLFDGQTLFGWKLNSNMNWSVQDGVIRADSGDPGLLLTTVPWVDFELRYEYRLEEGGNSGVFLRTGFDPKDPSADCYELNMCDTHLSFPTGSLVGRKKAHAKSIPADRWRSMHVRVSGTFLEARLDGVPVIEFNDTPGSVPGKGYIGLQMNGGRVEFRNIFLKPLGMQSIFNGKNLEGWRVVPGSKSEFTVDDGSIHVIDGAGFLETEDVWGNFVLQAEIKTNASDVNSGIFFRAMTGSEDAPSHGYELQIHNGFADGDRTKPNDYGTGFGSGAIFRRQKARRVVADDGEWFTMTLVANGARFASWVNGHQVTDWTDERDPHENPRKGRRVDPGHFSLQGHDSTTDLQFRNLRATRPAR